MVDFLSRNVSARVKTECVLVVFRVKCTKSKISRRVLWIAKRTGESYFWSILHETLLKDTPF